MGGKETEQWFFLAIFPKLVTPFLNTDQIPFPTITTWDVESQLEKKKKKGAGGINWKVDGEAEERI